MASGPLSNAQVDQFLTNGFVQLKGCFDASPGSLADEWVRQSWVRNGLQPDQPDAWPGRIHMPARDYVDVETFAPKAYGAICQLCGGEDRIQQPVRWSNGFIINYCDRSEEAYAPPGPDSPGYHKDGDFFRHFLDSPEQALLTLILWSDVVSQGGPTFVAADSPHRVARYLFEHPEGLTPAQTDSRRLAAACTDFREATGEAGDVYLLHPFMLHASSPNQLKRPRILTNPPVAFREPMRFDRPEEELAPVEQVIVRAIGRGPFTYEITGKRERLVPERLKIQADLAKAEESRLSGSSS